MAANQKTTSPQIATLTAKVLNDPNSSSIQKELAS